MFRPGNRVDHGTDREGLAVNWWPQNLDKLVADKRAALVAHLEQVLSD
jgi:hypothetical protein